MMDEKSGEISLFVGDDGEYFGIFSPHGYFCRGGDNFVADGDEF